MRSVSWTVIALFALSATGAAADRLPMRYPTPFETVAETVLEAAYRHCIRTVTIHGRELVLRLPFAMEGERRDGRFVQRVDRQGKVHPEALWERIDTVLRSDAFTEYAALIAGPGAKRVTFDLPSGTYRTAPLEQGALGMESSLTPGTSAVISRVRPGGPLRTDDVYDYLYCVAAVGIDCSAFVFYAMETLADAAGSDLSAALAAQLEIPASQVRRTITTWFLDPARGLTTPVADTVSTLRPGDLLLFRGKDGHFAHSAVVQSVDMDDGAVCYLQSTDWAPRDERGVHDSVIRFDPETPDVSLRDPAVVWTQQIAPAFPDEEQPGPWRTDGDRFRAHAESGGGAVVRLDALTRAIAAVEPGYH